MRIAELFATRRRRILWIVLVFTPLFLAWHLSQLHDRGLGGDARQFVAAGYHIAHGQGFSEIMDPDTAEPLDAYRPPAYPAFLALMIRAVPSLAHDRFEWFFHPQDFDGLHAPPGMQAIKVAQVLLLLGMSVLAMLMAWELCGSRWAAGLALAATALHPFLTQHVNRFYSELFATGLVTLFAWLFHLCVRRPLGLRDWWRPVAAGLTLGALTLTLAQWWYIGPFCLAYLLFVAWRDPARRRGLVVSALVVGLLMAAVVTPWKLRNQERFGRAFITERGGIALDLRSRYVMMTPEEIAASFFYWSRASVLRQVLTALLDPEQYHNLVREEGYYRAALRRSGELEAAYPRAVADRIQFNEAARRILTHPWNYLRTLPSLTYRGMVDGHWSLCNIPLYCLCLYALWRALRRRDWAGAALLAPFLGLFLFDSLVTHNIGRYNAVGTPLLLAGAMAGGREWWRRRGRLAAAEARLARKRLTGAGADGTEPEKTESKGTGGDQEPETSPR
ncbi:MAG: hypothetical protein AB7D57_04000 [Desulfovibrionaceae bacterium]